MSAKPGRDGKYNGEIVGDWVWTGAEGRWVSLDEPQTAPVADLDL